MEKENTTRKPRPLTMLLTRAGGLLVLGPLWFVVLAMDGSRTITLLARIAAGLMSLGLVVAELIEENRSAKAGRAQKSNS
jgi:hypothetical protein